ncbi:MAG TPA: hypothetical protein VFF65_09445, partial [Phycisphaerales bacterium]|nr:hypothetical protein [Phycisphaerales bacterium]
QRGALARRTRAELGLLLLCLKAALLSDPAYTRNGHSAADGWVATLKRRGVHAMTAARAIETAVEWADQAVVLELVEEGRKKILPPLCEASHIAPLAARVFPGRFSGETAAWPAERAAFVELLHRTKVESRSAVLAGRERSEPADAGTRVAAVRELAALLARSPLFDAHIRRDLRMCGLSGAEADELAAAMATVARLAPRVGRVKGQKIQAGAPVRGAQSA